MKVTPSPTAKHDEKVFATKLVELKGVDMNKSGSSWNRQEITPEPLLVSERFNDISKGHLEAQLPAVRRKEHFKLVLKSDMRSNGDHRNTRSSSGMELGPPGEWTIDPRGKQWVAYFDQAIAVSLTYTAFVTPYEIGFLGNRKQEIDILFILGNLINLVFMIDFVLNFFLQFERSSENGGIYEGNHKQIVLNYVKSHCMVDFASSVPWDVVELLTGANSGLSGLRLLRLLRLLKLLRIIRGSRLIEKYKAEFQFSFAHVTLGLYVATIMLFAHWVACLWGYAATSREEEGNTWMAAEEIEDSGAFTQYTVAVYFAVMTITTVGYGDVTPQNRDEYILVTIVMIAGGFLWAYVIGGICSLVATMNFDKRRFQQDFDRVNGMLTDLGMPASFCTYVRRYMFNAEPMLRRNTYNELILLLTPHQQREIAVHRSRANLVQVPYFRDCSPESVLKIYSALKQMVYAPQEMLDMPHTLFIIVNNGIVVKSGQIYSMGSCLAVDFILESEHLIDKSVGTALTFVQVETLHHKTLFKVLESFPVDRVVVRRAKIRLALMRKVVELAQIELSNRQGDGDKKLKNFRRWSVNTRIKDGMARSLSTMPVIQRKVSTSEASVMYAVAPRSHSISDESYPPSRKKERAPSPQFQGRVKEGGSAPSPKSFIDKMSSDRQHGLHLSINTPAPAGAGRSLARASYTQGMSPSRNNSFDNGVVLSDIKASVKAMEDRTSRIESSLLQVTQALSSLTTRLELKSIDSKVSNKDKVEEVELNEDFNVSDVENRDFSEATLLSISPKNKSGQSSGSGNESFK